MTVGAYNDMDSAALARLIEESFGFKMRELEAKLQMGQQDIDARWDIAKLQSQTSRYEAGLQSATSRYGVDVQSRTSRYNTDVQAATERQRLALMREEMTAIGIPDMLTRRYIAEKNYEIARSELSFKIASTAAELASTPDTFWMAKDFYDSLGTLQAGGKLPTFSQPDGAPEMKSLSTLTAQLSGNDPLAAAGQLVGANGPAANIDYSAAGASGGGGALSGTAPGTVVPTDPRIAAAAGVVAGSPPSVGNGYTDADIQALQTIGSIYQQGLGALGPQALESMTPSQQKLLMAGGSRLGYYNPDELRRYTASRIYQDQGSGAA